MIVKRFSTGHIFFTIFFRRVGIYTYAPASFAVVHCRRMTYIVIDFYSLGTLLLFIANAGRVFCFQMDDSCTVPSTSASFPRGVSLSSVIIDLPFLYCVSFNLNL